MRDHPAVLRLAGFLSRNGHPHQGFDPATDASAKALIERFDVETSELPMVLCPNGRLLRNPTEVELAACIGLVQPAHRAARVSHVPTHVLCSWRTADDVIYRDELARLAARADGLEVTHTLTRRAPADWRGPTRRIDREMLSERLPGPDARPFSYICGPTPFVESVARLLVSLEHAPERIRIERFGPTRGAQ